MSKNLAVSPNYVLYELSYANALLYSAATPLYDDEDDTFHDMDDFEDVPHSKDTFMGLPIERGLPI